VPQRSAPAPADQLSAHIGGALGVAAGGFLGLASVTGIAWVTLHLTLFNAEAAGFLLALPVCTAIGAVRLILQSRGRVKANAVRRLPAPEPWETAWNSSSSIGDVDPPVRASIPSPFFGTPVPVAVSGIGESLVEFGDRGYRFPWDADLSDGQPAAASAAAFGHVD
jgi:hypothetical protein